MKWLLLVAGLLTASVGCAEEQVALSKYQHRVDDQVTLAGLLNEAAYDELEAMDATIVDLRTAEEGNDVEARALIARGLRYVHLPMGEKSNLRDDALFLNQIISARPGKPVVVHCASANRASVLWAAAQLEKGEPLKAVMQSVDPVATKKRTRMMIKKYAENVR